MTFKEQINRDIEQTFMNALEFADIHTINGFKMPVVVDDYEHIDRERRYKFSHSLYADGIWMKEMLIYVKDKDLKEHDIKPVIKRNMTFDNKIYIISEAIEEDGIWSITLGANKT